MDLERRRIVSIHDPLVSPVVLLTQRNRLIRRLNAVLHSDDIDRDGHRPLFAMSATTS